MFHEGEVQPSGILSTSSDKESTRAFRREIDSPRSAGFPMMIFYFLSGPNLYKSGIVLPETTGRL